MKNIAEKSRQFAVNAHSGQTRKYTGEPYVNHPGAVAALVSQVTNDEDMIAAAWLHDVVEDTDCSIEDIRAEFGERVASLVADLTDVSRPQDGNRKARKAMDREHTKRASPEAKTVKLADIIDNGRDIARNARHFAVVYMREIKLLLPHLSDGDPALFRMAQEIVDRYYRDTKG